MLSPRQGTFVVELIDVGNEQIGVLDTTVDLLGFIRRDDNRNVGTLNRTLPGGRKGGSFVDLYQLIADILTERGTKISKFTARVINYARSGQYKLQIDVASNPN